VGDLDGAWLRPVDAADPIHFGLQSPRPVTGRTLVGLISKLAAVRVRGLIAIARRAFGWRCVELSCASALRLLEHSSAKAAVNGIRAIKKVGYGVKTVQEYH
jgi:hypothetical protein